MNESYFVPVIQTFIRAVPVAYRRLVIDHEATVFISVNQFPSLRFCLQNKGGWQLVDCGGKADTEIAIDAEAVWKLFTKGISAEEAKLKSEISGDQKLAEPFFLTRAVMA